MNLFREKKTLNQEEYNKIYDNLINFKENLSYTLTYEIRELQKVLIALSKKYPKLYSALYTNNSKNREIIKLDDDDMNNIINKFNESIDTFLLFVKNGFFTLSSLITFP